MLYSLLQSSFRIVKSILFQPLVNIVDKYYKVEVHSKHEKLAKDVSSLVCTPSGFLDKTRKEQVEILAVDLMLIISNLSLILGLNVFTKYILHIPGLNWNEFLYTSLFLYFGVDFTSGLIHFTLDNPATKKHPLITVSNLAWQFQDHHDKPYDNTLPPLLHTLCNFSFAIFPPICCNFLYTYFFKVNMVSYSLLSYLLVTFSQYIHRSIHYRDDQRAPYIKMLMYLNIVQNVENHHKHHKTFDCYYCTLSGWSDPLIHYLKSKLTDSLYEKVDWFRVTLYWLFGCMPILYIFYMKILHFILI